MAAFQTMVDTLLADPNLAQAATYTPVSGAAKSVQVVRRTPPQEAGLFETHAKLAAYAADVRLTEVSQPQENDTLAVGGDTFKVRAWQFDEERLVWQLDLDKQ